MDERLEICEQFNRFFIKNYDQNNVLIKSNCFSQVRHNFLSGVEPVSVSYGLKFGVLGIIPPEAEKEYYALIKKLSEINNNF